MDAAGDDLLLLLRLLGQVFVFHQIKILIRFARRNATALGTVRQQFHSRFEVVAQGFDSGFLTSERAMI